MENSATLLLYRQDRKGLVFVIARFLLQHGRNTLHAAQHHLGCATEQRQSGTGNTDRYLLLLLCFLGPRTLVRGAPVLFLWGSAKTQTSPRLSS
jgi:hypothetical protein